MWVLEARKDAEKVWFPVVWEEKKDPSNVVDYDIHEEQTKDTAAMINANNQTTTGMATVIPWVNAPKLLAKTSIIWSLWAEWWVWWVNISWTRMLQYPDDTQWPIRNWTLSWERWDLWFTNITDSWLKIPESWRYQFDINYPLWWSNRYIVTELRYIRWSSQSQELYTHTWQTSSSQETESIRVELKKWDILFALLVLHYVWTSSSFTTYANMSITITKL